MVTSNKNDEKLEIKMQPLPERIKLILWAKIEEVRHALEAGKIQRKSDKRRFKKSTE